MRSPLQIAVMEFRELLFISYIVRGKEELCFNQKTMATYKLNVSVKQ